MRVLPNENTYLVLENCEKFKFCLPNIFAKNLATDLIKGQYALLYVKSKWQKPMAPSNSTIFTD